MIGRRRVAHGSTAASERRAGTPRLSPWSMASMRSYDLSRTIDVNLIAIGIPSLRQRTRKAGYCLNR